MKKKSKKEDGKNKKKNNYFEIKQSEKYFIYLQGVFIAIFLALFFYRHILGAIPLSVFSYFFVKNEIRKLELNQKRNFLIEFKECILAMKTFLKIGYAVENAIVESKKDIRMLFGSHSMILKELDFISRGLENNIALESMFCELGLKTEIEEIKEFAEIFIIAKKNGGNMLEIIENFSEIIRDKLENEEETKVLLASKKMEQKIMNIMPFGIYGYIYITNPDYFDSLYYNQRGILIMTCCCVLYLVAYMLSEKIDQQCLEGMF